MNVLEKILKEIEGKTIIVATSKEHYNQPQNGEFVEEVITIKNVEDIIRSHMNEATSKVSDDSIDRKTLKEEIENLTMTITGMRSGKTMTTQALEEYKKSILRIIDEQPTVHTNDNWIPVEENQLEARYDVFLSKETEGLTIDKEIRLDHKPTREELKTLIRTYKMKAAWYIKRYCYNPCKGCFGAANNDCGKCEYGGGSSE